MNRPGSDAGGRRRRLFLKARCAVRLRAVFCETAVPIIDQSVFSSNINTLCKDVPRKSLQQDAKAGFSRRYASL
jgi:hypothetical protein